DRNVPQDIEHRGEIGVLRKAGREPSREIIRGRVADVPDAEREKDAREWPHLRGLDALVNVRRALFGEALDREQLLDGEVENIRGIAHEGDLHEGLDGLPAESVVI